MATHVLTQQAPQPAPDKAKGPAASGGGNNDAERQARRARALSVVGLITDRWKTPTQGLFDLDKPPNAAFTPAMFRALTYDLTSAGAKNGMNLDEASAAGSFEEAKLV